MFTQIFGIEIPAPIGFILLFIGLILVVVLFAWLIKSLGGKRVGGMAASGRSRQPRLGVLDVLAIDGRRRLVIVRRDNVEHLVLIGGPNDVVVESGILRVPAGTNAQREAPAFPAETRAAPPQPVPPSAPAGPRAPQPERPAPAQPVAVRAPEGARQPVLSPQRAVEQPPVPPMREAPKVQPAPLAPQAAQPSAIPTAPTPRPAAPPVAAPVRPAPPAAAPSSPAPTIQAPAVAAPARPAQQQPIAAGPAPRAEGPHSSEIADRLAAALKRPVSPVAAAPRPDSVPAPVPVAPKTETPAPESKAEAPSVRPGARPAPAPAPATVPEDDDPLSSLEAEMANLLGRDVGKPKP